MTTSWFPYIHAQLCHFVLGTYRASYHRYMAFKKTTFVMCILSHTSIYTDAYSDVWYDVIRYMSNCSGKLEEAPTSTTGRETQTTLSQMALGIKTAIKHKTLKPRLSKLTESRPSNSTAMIIRTVIPQKQLYWTDTK